MIDFNELNAMIDKVNTVIVDMNDDTKRNKNELENLKETVYNNAIAELLKYCDIFMKAIGDFDRDIVIEIPIGHNEGRLQFTRRVPYSTPCGTYAVEVTNDDAPFYRIIENNGFKKSTRRDYNEINHNHKSIVWFENLCADWDNIKDTMEDGVVNGVNYILKQRAEIAHKENEKAKKSLNKFLEN